MFGSTQLDRDELLRVHGEQLIELVRAVAGRDLERELALCAALEHDLGDFAFARASAITYYEPRAVYVTIDLVDRADAARRMPFLPPPSARLPDPDGLIALWDEYQHKTHELAMAGTLGDDLACPFWHCLTFAHAELVPYRELFATRVPPREAELAAILHTDQRSRHRAHAAFLLAHLASGDRVVEHVASAIRDPDGAVRNNAMRVLAAIAHDHPEIEIPLEPILGALEFPLTTDRNKASAILDALARRDEHKPVIRARSGATLVAMLALRQPNNHDIAYRILKTISGRDFGEHDVAAWRSAVPTATRRP